MGVRVAGVGDNCLDWYVDRGLVYPGGNAVNVAVHARRMGAESCYIGQFGTDRAADIMIEALRAEQVDISRIRRVPGTSGYATIGNVAGDRVFLGSSNGVVAFEPDADDHAFLAGASVIHTGDSSFLESSVEALAGIAPVSFDFSTADLDYCRQLLPAVSYATFSRPGLAADEVAELVAWAHGLGAREVYVTQGADGSFASDGHQLHHQSAAPVAALVDTLGAGDTFIAGMLTARLGGAGLAQAAAFAAERAAAACGWFGAFGHESSAEAMVLAPDHRDASDLDL